MNQPFIYKYRPINIKEFEMDKQLLDLLNALIIMDNLNIILYGNPGCGKTTLINCIIREYYKNDYNKNNILIINTLKEQGISYYRNEVKTFCQIMCSIPNKKKIVVLDDIDIINEQSQQVFRNCIDKYSSNVHFISSCNNIQKVIDSLQSRVFIVKLKLIDNNSLKEIINKICKNEEINVSKEAIEFIISISSNSIRTIINYLEKFKLISLNITEDIAKKLCTNIYFNDFVKFTTLCKSKDNLNNAIMIIYGIYDQGYSVIDILDNYFIFIKCTNIVNDVEKYKIIKLLCKYICIFYNIHEDEIELALFTNNLINIL